VLFFPPRPAASPPSKPRVRIGLWRVFPAPSLVPVSEEQRGGVVRDGYDENYETIKRASTTRFMSHDLERRILLQITHRFFFFSVV